MTVSLMAAHGEARGLGMEGGDRPTARGRGLGGEGRAGAGGDGGEAARGAGGERAAAVPLACKLLVSILVAGFCICVVDDGNGEAPPASP